MGGEWTLRRLGSVVSKLGSGATPRGGSNVYVDSGVALIRSQNIYDEGFAVAGLARVTDEVAQQLAGVAVQEGDVLVNITGDSVGRVSRAPAAVIPARVNQHVAIVRPDPRVVDGRFLHGLLVSPAKKRELLALASAGATRKALTKAMLAEMELRLPPLAEQRAIAAVLAALDDKIESNQRIASRLETLAVREFTVRFGRLIEGPTPLTELVDVIPGRSYKSSELGDDSATALLSLKSIAAGGGYQPGGLKPYSGAYKPNQALAAGDVVVAVTDLTQAANVVGRAARVPTQRQFETLVASLDIVILRPKAPGLGSYLLGLFRSRPWLQQALGYSNGSTVLHLSKKAFSEFLVRCPEVPELAALACTCDPLYLHSDALKGEAQTLAALRDALLPKLVSGRVRVPPTRDEQEAVETVVAELETGSAAGY